MTLEARAPPFRFPCTLSTLAAAATEGGGGTTLAVSEVLPPFAPFALTDGGGGTTSVGPKILPIRLLMNDPLPDCVGGGGTIVLEGSGTLPLARRCKSCEMSDEGGGAITEGAGKANLGSREVTRSGAEAGGGTTATFAICTGALEISRLTPPGAGGMMLAAREGAERPAS